MTKPRSPFAHPGWIPCVTDGARILVVGASGGLGRAVVDMLLDGSNCEIGAHGNTQPGYGGDDKRVHKLQGALTNAGDCEKLVEDFRAAAGGIDGLVMLAGNLTTTDHWDGLSPEQWEADIQMNLNVPFYTARAALRVMKAQGRGGRIVLNGTESALHGGSAQSFPYAIAKRGTEAMVQGLAREGADHSVLVNGVRLGFIDSGFHQRWTGRSKASMQERAEMVPLKRGGDPQEAAALIIYLLSGWSSFITGQMFALTGGDWL
jgi:3-oxoacyl-[acyl-carrier protein] reductase